MVIETKFSVGEDVYYPDYLQGKVVKRRIQTICTVTMEGYTRVVYFLENKSIGYVSEWFLFKTKEEAENLLEISYLVQ